MIVTKTGNTGRKGGQHGNTNASKTHLTENVYKNSAPKVVLAFENEHVNDREENALFIDARGSALVTKTGSDSRISFDEKEINYIKDNRATIMTHNHPYLSNQPNPKDDTNSGLSGGDIKSAAALGLREVRAVDKWYVHSFVFGSLSYHDFEAKLFWVSQKIAAQLDKAVANHKMTDTQADYVFATRRAKMLAESTGGRYTIYNRRTGAVVENVNEYGT